MARRCDICGKGTVAGQVVPRKGQAKKDGGVGQHIGVDNLSLGTEIELSNNFGSTYGFKCRPCLGVKWDF